MFKVIGILKRPEGMSVGEFRRWWFDEHAPKVKRWPGLVGYHLNMAVSDDEEFDGVAEVWFDSERSARDVFSTPEGAAARESALGGSGRSVIFVAEETVVVPLAEAPA
jgi:uncharacterized protein (TIGR02118 family)